MSDNKFQQWVESKPAIFWASVCGGFIAFALITTILTFYFAGITPGFVTFLVFASVIVAFIVAIAVYTEVR